MAGGKQGDTSATVKLTSDITSIVSFKPLHPSLHTVTATHGAHGSLTALPAPVGGKIAKDTEMTFTATPDSGYKVDMWFVSGGEILSGGNDEEASVTVKISANTTVRVTFKAEEAASPATEYFTAAMTHGEHGRVSASPKIPADGKIAKDTEMTFSAKPETGYCVEKWTITGGTFIAGTGTDGSATAKVKIAADTTVRITFKKLPEGTYAAAMGHGEHGLIAAEPAIPANGAVAKDTDITFTATPGSGYKVDMWFVSGGEILSGGNDEEASVTVKISANTTVRVTFKAASPAPAAEMVAVTMTHGDNGNLTAVPAPVDGKAAKDSEITFIASPKAGYAVDAWTVTPASALKADGKAGDLLAKVKITAATTVRVTFKPIAYSVTFSAADAKGTVSATLDGAPFTGGKVPFGKSVLFTANPIYGYQADMWIIAGGEIQSGGQTTRRRRLKSRRIRRCA